MNKALGDPIFGKRSRDGESVGKARILVVDDSKLMRKAAHKMLGDEFDAG